MTTVVAGTLVTAFILCSIQVQQFRGFRALPYGCFPLSRVRIWMNVTLETADLYLSLIPGATNTTSPLLDRQLQVRYR